MTYIPICQWDDHFWPKKKCLFYVAYGNGSVFDRYRLRFCPEHAALIDEHLTEHKALITQLALDYRDRSAPDCFSCGEPLGEGGAQVFLTGYPTQDERKDYWFQIHKSCPLPEYLLSS